MSSPVFRSWLRVLVLCLLPMSALAVACGGGAGLGEKCAVSGDCKDGLQCNQNLCDHCQ